MFKKLISAVLVVITIFSCFIISAGAVSVDLYTDQTTVTSSAVSAKQCKMSGTNFSVSKHMVYFTAQCKSTSGSYTDDVYRYVHVDDSFSGVYTTSVSSSVNWRIKLNPTGIYKNCRATGTIVKYK
ncbi:MAG: hypothetical protein ACI4KD_05250 [Oscillospiraceae bacterium]